MGSRQNLVVVDHPLVRHKLTLMRSKVVPTTERRRGAAAALMVEYLHLINHDLNLTRGPSAPRTLSALLEP